MMTFQVTALGIGHGDAILIRAFDKATAFTILVDGGGSPDRLKTALNRNQIQKIDLLIVTHIDSDHLNGLLGIEIPVTQYWGPALRAFSRHKWLFGERCAKAVERAEELEDHLRKNETDILYPLEGFSSSPFEGIRIGVLNPAARFIKSLLRSPNASNLVSDEAALGWLLKPEPAEEENFELDIFLDHQLSRAFLDPADLTNIPNSNQIETPATPEFWGDRMLNNTSIVAYLELQTGLQTFSVLLPGDLEDWTYLLGRNPKGLNADILKAPHHGGRVYLGSSREAIGEVLSTVRPKAVLVSANGQYGLPRLSFREAARNFGATVFCTSQREFEFVTHTPIDVGNCCFKTHECTNSFEQDTTILISDQRIHSCRPACSTGFSTSLGPILNIRQHVINPSPILSELRENELRGHIKWVQKTLWRFHDSRKESRTSDIGGKLITIQQIHDVAMAEERWPIRAHLQVILEQGNTRNKFFAPFESRHHRHIASAYALPIKEEITMFLEFVNSIGLFVAHINRPPIQLSADSVFDAIKTTGLAMACESRHGYPEDVFDQVFWPALKVFFLNNWHCYCGPGNYGGKSAVFIRSDLRLLETLVSLGIENYRDLYFNADSSGYGNSNYLIGPMGEENNLMWKISIPMEVTSDIQYWNRLF